MPDLEQNEKPLNELKEEAKEASQLLECTAKETRQAYTELAREVQCAVSFMQQVVEICSISESASDLTSDYTIPETEKYQEDSQEKLNILSEGLNTVSQAGILLTLPAAVAIAAPTMVIAPIGLAVSGGILASSLFFKDKKEKEERREAKEYLLRSEKERKVYEAKTIEIRKMKEELAHWRMLAEPSLVYFRDRGNISAYDKEEEQMLLETRAHMEDKLREIKDYFSV